MGGIGAAAGPLIGGLITTAISWRAAFVFQALVVAAHRRAQPTASRTRCQPIRPAAFDTIGAVLSAVGLVLVVMGILAADNNAWLMRRPHRCGACSSSSRSSSTSAAANAHGKEPLLSTALFRNRTSRTSAWSPRTSSGCC